MKQRTYTQVVWNLMELFDQVNKKELIDLVWRIRPAETFKTTKQSVEWELANDRYPGTNTRRYKSDGRGNWSIN